MYPPFASPERLLARFQQSGEPRDLGRLFDRVAPELLRVATWLSGNRADAEDLLQRTFLTVLTSRGSYDAGRRAMPWLCGILGNHARKLHEQRARRLDLDEPAGERDPAAAAADAEFARAVARVRGELGSPYAEVLDLHLGEGLDARTIAGRLGRPAGTVRTQIVRGLALLRRNLPSGFVTGILLTTTVQAASLAAVRAAVMRAAGAPVGAAAAVAGGVVLTLGGIVMAKKLLVVVPLLALLLGGGAWLLLRESENPLAVPPAHAALVVANVEGARAPTAMPAPDAESPLRTAVVATPEVAPEAGFARLVVRIRWHDDQSAAAGVGVMAMPQPGNCIHEREGLTDARGELVLRRIQPGSCYVVSAFTELKVLDLTAATVVTVDLVGKRTGFVEGIVVDAVQNPVADARLWLSDNGGPFRGFEVARSGRDGRFRIVFTAGQQLGARKAGHAPSRLRELGASNPDIVLTLPAAGGTVRGRVVDAETRPIADARLEIGLSGGWRIPGSTLAELFTHPTAPKIATDERGEFVCEGVAAGSTEVRAWASGYGPTTDRTLVEVGRTAEVLIVLPRGAAVEGIVRDSSGSAIANATVVRTGNHYDFGRSVTESDTDGRFRLENLPPGDVSLTVIARERKCRETITTTAGTTTTWNPVVVDAKGKLAGRIVGPDGQPLANLRIGILAPGAFHLSPNASTDAAGQFVLRGFDARKVKLQVECDDTQLATREDVVVSDEPMVITLTSAEMPTAHVRGRVIDVEGKPLPASLTIMNRTWQSCPGTPAGADGTFHRGPLPAGVYRVQVEATGFGQLPLPDVPLAPGDDKTLPDIVLARAGRVDLALRGDESTSGGGMFKIVRDDGVAVVWVTPEGNHATAELPPGSYFAVASSQRTMGHVAFSVRSELTTTAVLTFVPAARVTFVCSIGATASSDILWVVVRDSGGAITDSAEMHMMNRRAGTPLEWRTQLPAGTYSVQAWIGDGRTATATVMVTDTASTSNVVLEFAPR